MDDGSWPGRAEAKLKFVATNRPLAGALQLDFRAHREGRLVAGKSNSVIAFARLLITTKRPSKQGDLHDKLPHLGDQRPWIGASHGESSAA